MVLICGKYSELIALKWQPNNFKILVLLGKPPHDEFEMDSVGLVTLKC